MIGIGPHQTDDAVLGRRVAERARIVAADADEACGRTGQHDGSAVALVHQRRYRDVDGVVHAGEVDVDDVAPTLSAGLHRGYAGIRDDDVEPAELVEAGLQRGLQRIAIANVGRSRDYPPTGVL